MMINSNMARLQRQQLEQQFKKERRLPLQSPRKGWIFAIRQSLGMTASQLARKLGIAKQSMKVIEESEKKGTITVTTLKKVADVLGCHVKVILIPKEPLGDLLKKRAIDQATKIVQQTDLQMKLEKQGTDEQFQKQQIEVFAEELVRKLDRRLWDDVL